MIWDGHVNSVPIVAAKAAAMEQKTKAASAIPLNEANKRQKLDANALQITVQIPNGDPIYFTDLTPLWTVSQLKERLVPMCGIVASKQKLSSADGTVMRNAFSLDVSGIRNGDILTLSGKERGGKAK